MGELALATAAARIVSSVSGGTVATAPGGLALTDIKPRVGARAFSAVAMLSRC